MTILFNFNSISPSSGNQGQTLSVTISGSNMDYSVVRNKIWSLDLVSGVEVICFMVLLVMRVVIIYMEL